MNQSVLTLAPGGLPLAQALGYTAASVIVDNYTSSYVSLPDAGKTIPPWVYGAVVSLPPGVRRADATLIPTVPAIPGPPVPVVQASLTWTDQVLPANAGHLLQQAAYGITTVLDRFDTSLLATKTYTLPGGTASVGVGIDLNETLPGTSDPLHSVIPASITLTGLPSGANYLLFVPNAALRQLFWAAVNPEDTRLNITIDGVHPNGCFVDVLTSPLVIAGQGGDQLGNLSVSLQRSLPAPWQSPSTGFETGSGTVAASGNLALATVPPGGLSSYLHQLNVEIGTAVAGVTFSVQDTGGVNLGVRIDGTYVHSFIHDFKGRNIGAKGVQLHNNAGVGSGQINASIDVNQSS